MNVSLVDPRLKKKISISKVHLLTKRERSRSMAWELVRLDLGGGEPLFFFSIGIRGKSIRSPGRIRATLTFVHVESEKFPPSIVIHVSLSILTFHTRLEFLVKRVPSSPLPSNPPSVQFYATVRVFPSMWSAVLLVVVVVSSITCHHSRDNAVFFEGLD